MHFNISQRGGNIPFEQNMSEKIKQKFDIYIEQILMTRTYNLFRC